MRSCHYEFAFTGGGPLADGFRDPPASTRLRVWRRWMNGDITQKRADLDLTWMKLGGIGGFQNFDAALAGENVPIQTCERRLSRLRDARPDTVRRGHRTEKSPL